MRSSRRRFLWASGLALTTPIAALRGAGARLVQPRPFDGARAGQERTVGGVRLCWCPPGRFRMGSPLSERSRRPDEAQVDVTLTQGFWAGTFEVTQGQWRRVAGGFPGRPPSPGFGEGDDVPVYWVSCDDAVRFCRLLTSAARQSGMLPEPWAFRLPTEAQWEYACRAGTTTATAFGDSLDVDHANFDPDADTRATRRPGGSRPVGSYPANPWGLHDMHGNVWEWCRDYYHARLPGGTDPDLSDVLGMRNGDGTYSRVRRGGAWIEGAAFCRSACRLRYEPDRSSDHIGFRVVASTL